MEPSLLLFSSDSIGDTVYNSIRKSDDTLDSSPLLVDVICPRTIIQHFLQVLVQPSGSRSRTGIEATDTDALLLSHQRSLCDLLSEHTFVECCYFDGGQPYVYCEDPPFLKATDPLETAVTAVTQASSSGSSRKRKSSHGESASSSTPPATLAYTVTIAVQRAFPLSSSHQGRSFRLACMMCIPLSGAGAEGESPRALISFSRPFKVLAKQGRRGSKPKLVHPSRFERLTQEREAVLRAVLSSAAAVRPALLPSDPKQLAVSSAGVDSSTLALAHPRVPPASDGRGEPEPPPAAIHLQGSSTAGTGTGDESGAAPHALPIAIPASLLNLQSSLALSIVGAHPQIMGAGMEGQLPEAGSTYTHAARAPKPKRQSGSNSRDRSADEDGGESVNKEGTAAGAGPVAKRPKRSAAVQAAESIRKSLAKQGEPLESREEQQVPVPAPPPASTGIAASPPLPHALAAPYHRTSPEWRGARHSALTAPHAGPANESPGSLPCVPSLHTGSSSGSALGPRVEGAGVGMHRTPSFLRSLTPPAANILGLASPSLVLGITTESQSAGVGIGLPSQGLARLPSLSPTNLQGPMGIGVMQGTGTGGSQGPTIASILGLSPHLSTVGMPSAHEQSGKPPYLGIPVCLAPLLPSTAQAVGNGTKES